MAEHLTPEQLLERDRSFVERIISNDDFAYYFFHEKCFNLFRKIQWTIFGEDTDYDEIINSFYEYLKRPDLEKGEYWHKLKSFDYRTSLFDWIKTVAIRFFYEPCVEKLQIPDSFIDSGLFEKMISDLKSAEARKYFWFSFVLNYPKPEICRRFNLDSKQLLLLKRRSETALRQLVKKKYPDYYGQLFHKEGVIQVDFESASNLPNGDDSSQSTTKQDIRALVAQMPNPRYRTIIEGLFFRDLDPEELAIELNMRVSNVYNIKSRALEQLRDLILFSPGEIDVPKYIIRMTDDRLRQVASSIFEKRMEYDAVIKQLGITDSEFKKLKRAAIKELKLLVFN